MENKKTTSDKLYRKSVDDFKKSSKSPIFIILDNVRSAMNIGSIFRTSDAFLIEYIYICGISACPPNKEIEKTALGATQSVSWKYFNTTLEAIEYLKEQKIEIWAIEQTSESIALQNFRFNKSKRYGLVFGNEVNGVDRKVINLCTGSIEIPQAGTKHSLNVAVCAGIVLWEFFK